MVLEVQRFISHVSFVFFGPLMSFLFHYRFRFSTYDIEEIRKRYRDTCREVDGPLLICTNHLTLIDSIVQSIILNSLGGYLSNYSSLAWSLPEKSNFYEKFHWRLICYFGKCIPVVRGSSAKERRKSVDKMKYVLKKGDTISIFPEGKRSRSGRVDNENYSYGVGNLITMGPEAKVLCIYLRGTQEGGFARFPQKGETFYLSMDLIEPHSKEKGKRAARDLSGQVINQLYSMEQEYFANAMASG
jgi:1-acyl-sn-glycerol-3-phosphate acyltransferase